MEVQRLDVLIGNKVIVTVDKGEIAFLEEIEEWEVPQIGKVVLEMVSHARLGMTVTNQAQLTIIYRTPSIPHYEYEMVVYDRRSVVIAKADLSRAWFDTEIDKASLAEAINILADVESLQLPFRVYF